MKNCIDLKQVQEVEEELSEQIAKICCLHEQIVQSGEKIKYMTHMEEMAYALEKSSDALNEDIRILNSMAAVLKQVCLAYQQTETRITDQYNLDTVVYPETRFDISKITGMAEYQELMPF